MKIPRIIHQTYSTNDIPLDIQSIIFQLKKNNPNWIYKFYNDKDVLHYIKDNFDDEILDAYLSINGKYGAARADFFRYLVVYNEGGVYLDIKSTCVYSLDSIINENDEIILCHWQNEVGMKSQFAGMHNELKECKFGEFQQWHVIAKPRSAFLEAVIKSIIENLKSYNPWTHGVGKPAVLRITGPIAYTKAIIPLLKNHPYTFYRYDKDIGLVYSNLNHDFKHMEIMNSHYSRCSDSVVGNLNLINRLNFYLYRLIRWTKRLLIN
ncbi:hypothetical protein C9E88_002480 [Acinetobacter cumulans]|uniref:glycosyltransferase family 32 protein n=1 Tax=Acinetobacter cumulans TaxID=2136182 RepID=UPI000D134242|nr:glycosyltransferase [Acinetobacter cumulans]QCO20467.1 hypothetical protein C9E88_002480 [Acinetobacter cumulans]